LPHAPTSSPSAFQNRTRASATAEGSITISWSQPTPRSRSAIARACAAVGANGAAPPPGCTRLDHDEVVAEAIHLDESASHGRAYSTRHARARMIRP
jgi:hypothetical protein